jgi:hypothetical protein
MPSQWNCPACNHSNAIATDGSRTSPQCGACEFTLRPVVESVLPLDAAPEADSADATAPKKSTTSKPKTFGATTLSAADTGAPLGAPGFDWVCRSKDCGTANDGTRSTCSECSEAIVPSNWNCGTCGATNFKLRSQCFDCRGEIQAAWLCLGCKKKTSIYEMHCRGCNEERPAARGARIGGGRGGGGGGNKPADWICGTCHKMNFGNRTTCRSCDTPRMMVSSADGDGVGNMAAMRPVGDNNWACRSCQSTNFRTRKDCWQCGGKRGAHAAPGSGIDEDANVLPAFSEDDEGFKHLSEQERAKQDGKKIFVARGDQTDEMAWICAKCLHQNFKHSKDCFKCYAPKAAAPMSRVVVVKKTKSFKL